MNTSLVLVVNLKKLSARSPVIQASGQGQMSFPVLNEIKPQTQRPANGLTENISPKRPFVT